MAESKDEMKAAIKVLISGAAGQIGYAIIPMVASGQCFGLNQPMDLVLLDIEPALPKLAGVAMEIDDGNYPLVNSVTQTADYATAFNGVQFALLVGGFPRLAGMERSELLSKNAEIFVATGKAIEQHADKNIKVLVVANPANTNALIASVNAPSVPKENFHAMTRLDHNRAASQLRKKAGATSMVQNVIIWGNHSSTQVPDATFATVDGQKVTDKVPADWLNSEFVPTVAKRGAAIIQARGASSAMSAANAAVNHMRDWFLGTPEGEWVSMAVAADGSYGVAEGIIYSFPCKVKDGKVEIVQGLEVTDAVKAAMKKSEEELRGERKIALKE